MIKTIDHIGIITNNLQQSVEFYTDVLGFSILAKIEMEDAGFSVIPINDHITFSVDDIEATVTDLKEKGVIFCLEPLQLEGGMKLASFKDPDGVLIELAEHPEQ